MAIRENHLNQLIGEEVPQWSGAQIPPQKPMTGRCCRIEPLNTDQHLSDLFEAYSTDRDDGRWTYMAIGPFPSIDELRVWMEAACQTDDPLFQAIIDTQTGRAVGIASYMRIQQSVGVIEVGNITYSMQLEKTTIATEAMYLMMKRVFEELGYRRYEWKCDALNAASRSAAERLGFTYEGLFRQALVYKGRNRDTAWYSILDGEWSALNRAYKKWLDPNNFVKNGQQLQGLKTLITSERCGP